MLLLLLLLRVVVMIVMRTTWMTLLGHTSVMVVVMGHIGGFEAHALELQPVMDNLEFIHTRLEPGKFRFEFLS